jgi:hypothetical protein
VTWIGCRHHVPRRATLLSQWKAGRHMYRARSSFNAR